MKVILKGEPKEIAALVLAAQGRWSKVNEALSVEEPRHLGQVVVGAMNDMQKDIRDKSLLRPEQPAGTED